MEVRVIQTKAIYLLSTKEDTMKLQMFKDGGKSRATISIESVLQEILYNDKTKQLKVKPMQLEGIQIIPDTDK